MSGKLRLNGATSGYSELQAPDVAGDQTFTLPAVGGELATKSGGGQVVGYQQGTWVGVLTGSATGTTTVDDGVYFWSRIGNLVTCWFNMNRGDKVTSGDIFVEGLPYAMTDSTFYSFGLIGDRKGTILANNYTDIYMRISKAASKLQLLQKNGEDHNSMVGGSINTNFTLRGNITYLTDDTTFVPINGATIS